MKKSLLRLKQEQPPGSQWKWKITHSITNHSRPSLECSEQYLTLTQISQSQSSDRAMSLYQQTSMLEPNGVLAFTPSETKLHADHAGLLDPQRHYQTDSALLQTERQTLSSHLKTCLLATPQISDVTVDTSTKHGAILPLQALSLTLVSHTPQEKELSHHAPNHALDQAHGPNTNARLTQLLPQEPPLAFNRKSIPTDLWKPHSMSTQTS